MSLRPTQSKRTRAYNIFVGFFFLAVIWAMVASGVIAEGDWTLKKIILQNVSLTIMTLVGLVAAVAHYRAGKRQ
jgi:hypothetical protein